VAALSAKRVLVLVGTIAVLSPLALWSGTAAVTDYRYELAGLADPFLGRPAPAASIFVGVILSLAFAGAMLFVRHFWRSSEGDRSALGWQWLLVPVVAWAGYFGGAATVIAGGGPVEYPGTLSLDFGQPIASTVQVNVTCWSVVGQPASMSELRHAGVTIFLRSMATGDEHGRPVMSWSLRPDLYTDLVPEAARARPAIVRQRLDGKGVVTGEEDVGFFQPYWWRVSGLSDGGLRGWFTLHLSRAKPIDDSWERFLNVTVADDPWPQELDMKVTWACGG